MNVSFLFNLLIFLMLICFFIADFIYENAEKCLFSLLKLITNHSIQIIKLITNHGIQIIKHQSRFCCEGGF